MSEALIAPPEGLEVRIMDLSDPDAAQPAELVRGFTSLAHANEFARRYVRDSVERCRVPRASAADVTAAWFAFGEDAVVEGAPEGQGWISANDLPSFAAAPPRDREALNWRIIDPRRLDDDEEDEDSGAEEGDA